MVDMEIRARCEFISNMVTGNRGHLQRYYTYTNMYIGTRLV